MDLRDRLARFSSRVGLLRSVNLLVFAALAAGLAALMILDQNATGRPERNARLGCVAILAYLSVVLGRRGNARLLPSLAALCVVSEVLIRAAGTLQPTIVSDVDWREPKPYFMFSGPVGKTMEAPPQMGGSEDGRLVRFNSEGFRIERDLTLPKPPGEIRIFVLGGSSVVHGAPLANTIPGVIERHLRESGLATARVYDFGVVSFVSGQELALLLHRLVDLEPDLIIAYDGGNDLMQPWFYDPRPGYPFNFAAWEVALDAFSSHSAGARKTLGGIAHDSALLRALLGRKQHRVQITMEERRRNANYGSEDWKRTVVDTYARNVGEMCRVARSHDILYAAWFQPMLPFSRDLADRQLAMSGGKELVQNLREQREWIATAVAQRLPSAAAGAGCRFVDLSGMFEERGSELFWDIIHVDNRGNQRIGRRIADDLLAWDALSPLRQ
jgi:lysophospholipase L1-like esterase